MVNESLEIKNCQEQFSQLVKVFGNDYSGCFINRKPIKSCFSQKNPPKVHVAVILDDSGSMAAKIENERMIDIAKTELNNYVSSLDNQVSGGVIVYGHKGNNSASGRNASCSGIELFGNFSEKTSLLQKISTLEPTGWTPIDASLRYAKNYLDGISGPDDQKVILLLSDGKETCGGNPVQTAKNIASMKNTFIDVIGFNVYGEVQKELQQIALAAGGKYSDVRSRIDFQNVFADMRAFSKEISCGVSQSAIALRNAAENLNTYYSCMMDLREEYGKILSNTTLSCYHDVKNLATLRSDKIEYRLKSFKEEIDRYLRNFEKSIEDVMQKF